MAKKKQPEGSCPYCWNFHSVSPGIQMPAGTDVFFLVETLDGPSIRFLTAEVKKYGITPCFVPLSLCNPMVIPSYQETKRVKELFLSRMFEEVPNQVIAFGQGAALVVGKCTDTSMVNKTLMQEGRTHAFTFSPKQYFDTRDRNVLNHIQSTIRASVASPRAYTILRGEDAWPNGGFKNIVVDVETTGKELPWYGSKLVLVGIKELGRDVHSFEPQEISEQAKRHMAQHVKTVVGHNVLFDLVHLAQHGIVFPNATIHDTLIYNKNAFPNARFYGLKAWAKQHHGYPHWDAWFSSNLGIQPESILDWWMLKQYNAGDLHATEDIYKVQQKRYMPFLLEMDYLKYVLRLILNGFKVDVAALDKLLAETSEALMKKEIETKGEHGLGTDFNFNSPSQVLSWLRSYNPRLTSTNADYLAEYKGEISAIDDLLEIRDLVKLKGTGLEGLKAKIDEKGLVHSSYAVHGAETGRSSSSNPNLQNTDPRSRPLFVSRYEGGKLVHTDLSGIEYRLIGHISEDRNLLYIFNGGLDIHDEMYKFLFNEPPPDKKRRKKAKTANFCVTRGTKVLKSSLSWVNAGEIKEGDELVAFDEERKSGNGRLGARRWRTSKVIHSHEEIQPCLQIQLDNGEKLRVTNEHKILVKHPDNKTSWFEAKDLRVGWRLPKYVPTWTDSKDYAHGWLGGFFDGEGHLSKNFFSISVAQTENPALCEVEKLLQECEYSYRYNKSGNSTAKILRLNGKMSNMLRFLGETKPKRLIENMQKKFNSDKSPLFGAFESPKIVSITDIGMQVIVVMQTSSKTFIGDGYGMHNCGVYGGGYWKFIISAELPDCPESRALYNKVNSRYPGVAAWKTHVIAGLYATGNVRNLFGRIRHFEHVDKNIEREAINWIIQSSGHDILKIYCMELNDEIERAGLKDVLFVSEVHDSNTFDCKPEDVEQVRAIVERVGSNLNPLIEEMFGVKMRVPIFAEVEVHKRWE